MMNDNSLLAFLRQHTPQPDAAFQNAVDQALTSLPQSKARRAHRPLSVAAAALAGALALSALAAVAVTVYQNVFGELRQEMNQEARLPEDVVTDRVKQQFASGSAAAVNLSAQAGEHTLTVINLFQYESGGKTCLALDFSLSPAPAGILPALDQLTLEQNGLELVLCGEAAQMAETKKPEYFEVNYRQGKAYFRLDFSGAQALSPGDTLTLSGTLHTYDEGFARTGSLGEFTLPIELSQSMFDRYEAELLEGAVVSHQNRTSESLETLSAIEAQSVPIGLSKQNAKGQTITLSEFSLLPDTGMLYVGYTFGGASITKLESLDYDLMIRMDGMDLPYAGSVENNEDYSLFVRSQPLARDLSSLPEESLVYVEAIHYGYDPDSGEPAPEATPFIFRYNWKDKKVTLPKDSAEEAEWFAQERASLKPGRNLFFNVGGVSQTVGDVTVALESVELEDGFLRVELSFDSLLTYDQADMWEFPAITLAGKPVLQEGGLGSDGQPEGEPRKRSISWNVVSPLHASELPELIPLSVDKTVYSFDASGNRTKLGEFHLETVLRLSDGVEFHEPTDLEAQKAEN